MGSRVTVLGRRVRDTSGAVIVVGRVQLLLGRVDGRVQGVRVQKVPTSHHILVCPVLVPFEVSHPQRVEGWSGQGYYATAAERKRHRPQTFAAQLPRLPQ